MMLAALVWSSAAAEQLTYLVHEPVTASAHPPLIVLLHGSGADERDMIGLWSQLPGAFVVISPRAPFRDDAGGYRWYRKGRVSENDIEVSHKSIDLLVDDAVKRFAVDPGEVFLAGFSQGGVMVYDMAFREPGRFHGAAVLSGSLPRSAFLERPAALPPFFVAHGTADQRIPLGAAVAARAALGRMGASSDFHAYPGLRHETGDAEIRDLSRWLAERVAARR